MDYQFHVPIVVIGLSAMVSWRSHFYQFPPAVKLFSLVWTFWFIMDAVGHVLAYSMQNHWLYNLLYIIYFPALMYTYQKQFTHGGLQRIIFWLYPVFFFFVVLNTFLIQGFHQHQTLTFVVGGSFIIFLSAAYFWYLYTSENNEKITRDPFFWFSFGLLVCYSGTVPFLGMLNYLWNRNPDFTRFYYQYVSNLFYILLSILIAIGFLCRKNFQK